MGWRGEVLFVIFYFTDVCDPCDIGGLLVPLLDEEEVVVVFVRVGRHLRQKKMYEKNKEKYGKN